jgi:hypothetical protein
MCASLMAADKATTEQLKRSIDRKLAKFGAVERMPLPTRDLVLKGMAELRRRYAQEERSSD